MFLVYQIICTSMGFEEVYKNSQCRETIQFCEGCTKSFVLSDHLKQHMRVYTRKSPTVFRRVPKATCGESCWREDFNIIYLSKFVLQAFKSPFWRESIQLLEMYKVICSIRLPLIAYENSCQREILYQFLLMKSQNFQI